MFQDGIDSLTKTLGSTIYRNCWYLLGKKKHKKTSIIEQVASHAVIIPLVIRRGPWSPSGSPELKVHHLLKTWPSDLVIKPTKPRFKHGIDKPSDQVSTRLSHKNDFYSDEKVYLF